MTPEKPDDRKSWTRSASMPRLPAGQGNWRVSEPMLSFRVHQMFRSWVPGPTNGHRIQWVCGGKMSTRSKVSISVSSSCSRTRTRPDARAGTRARSASSSPMRSYESGMTRSSHSGRSSSPSPNRVAMRLMPRCACASFTASSMFLEVAAVRRRHNRRVWDRVPLRLLGYRCRCSGLLSDPPHLR